MSGPYTSIIGQMSLTPAQAQSALGELEQAKDQAYVAIESLSSLLSMATNKDYQSGTVSMTFVSEAAWAIEGLNDLLQALDAIARRATATREQAA